MALSMSTSIPPRIQELSVAKVVFHIGDLKYILCSLLFDKLLSIVARDIFNVHIFVD